MTETTDSTPATSPLEGAQEHEAPGSDNVTGAGTETGAPQPEQGPTDANGSPVTADGPEPETQAPGIEPDTAQMALAKRAVNEGKLAHEALDRHLDDLLGKIYIKRVLSYSRAPFKDGIYDHLLTERREHFQNGRLVFAVSKDLLDSLGPTALPHQYRGTWGSYSDVPQG
ncbi:MAG TPA: hypothetical protein VNE18_10375 [Rhodanobacter sp.]|nr:hypothetical protein [Rhodanobacter sp.]